MTKYLISSYKIPCVCIKVRIFINFSELQNFTLKSIKYYLCKHANLQKKIYIYIYRNFKAFSFAREFACAIKLTKPFNA